MSCNASPISGRIPASDFSLTWKDSFNLGCGCKSGFVWNQINQNCESCPQYCKANIVRLTS